MRNERRVMGAAVVLAASLLTTACGDARSAASGGATTTTEPGASEARDQMAEVENLVAACMKKKGWDYTPMPPPDLGSMEPSSFGAVDEAYGKEHGYGLVDAFSGATGLGGNGSGIVVMGSAGVGGSASAFDDPNADYVASLSETERTQYLKDLGGGAAGAVSAAGVDTDSELGMLEAGPSGCLGEAMKATGMNNESGPIALNPGEDLANDPDVIEATAKWASCMSERGYPAESPDKVVQDFIENTIMPELNLSDPGSDPGGEPGNAEAPPAPEQSVVDALRAQEVELWTADNECQKSSGFREAQKRVLGRVAKAEK
jgi:hypothetical protein